MSPDHAHTLLTNDNLIRTALVLSALDCLQAKEFNLLEPSLRKLGKFSESNIVTASEHALESYTMMCIPGNGNGIKMTLSVFFRGLQVIGRGEQVEAVMTACNARENLTT